MPSTHAKAAALFLAATLVATMHAGPVQAAQRPDARETQLRRGLDRVVAAGVPGAVLLVRDRGGTIRLASGAGRLRPRTPMRVDDRFRVGSITKAFVATVVLQLVGEGKLTLEDTVDRWLPGAVPDGARITLRQLLDHTSGLFDFAADPGFVAAAFRDPLRAWTPQEIVATATAHPPYFAPGAGWAYSDTNYFVVGLIVEAATGHALASELQRRIVGPLRLRRTRFDSGPRIAGRHAHGYFLRPLEDVTVGSPSVQWAAGALVSTVDDVARFFRVLLGGRLLRADLLRAMRTTVPALLLGPGNEYGLGLQKLPLACGSAWGHTGASPGYSVDALNRRDGRRQVVLAVNATGALGAAGFFGAPASAQPAIERLIRTAYCGSAAPSVATPADSYPGGVSVDRDHCR